MNKKIILLLSAVALTLINVSCDSYLEETPDNRTELDSEEKIAKILVSAYPTNSPDLFLEQMADNIDESMGTGYSSFSRFQDQVYAWEDVTETDNESPARTWDAHYMAITNANQALDAIEALGNPERLDAYRGEALVCRAYAHFVLVNVFCKTYNGTTSSKDLGIPYMEEAETTLNPKYERGNVAEVYAKIEKDLEAGLPLISDNAYRVPKYHFNRQAAYSFGARFYLFYQKYDKVIECANTALGGTPAMILRNWKEMSTMTRNLDILSEFYIKADNKANFLMVTGYSRMGLINGGWLVGTKYRHHPYTASTETVMANTPWGNHSSTFGYVAPFPYDTPGSYRFVEMPRYPKLFEFNDPVAQTGYNRSIHVLFTADDALLMKAEASIMKKDYSAALEDMNMWIENRYRPGRYNVLTADVINTYYNNMAYYQPTVPTIKKKLNPLFVVEPGQQENFIHCVLQMRRLENYSTGLRWYDINRYGIVICRRAIDNNNVVTQTDEMGVDDLRRAIQLPAEVISAGMTANPR